MNAVSQFFSLLRWDLLRELRRRESLFNMTLFAVLILFTGELGVEIFARHFVVAITPVTLTGDELFRQQAIAMELAKHNLGPIFFWIAVLFAGTVGLNQSFAAEREGQNLGAIVTSPVDPGTFYLVKVVATWTYVSAMTVVLLAAYVFLFNDLRLLKAWPVLLPAVAGFTLAYTAPGVVLAAMTTSLRGAGEVVLRILLLVLMIPLISLTLEVSAQLFGFAADGPPILGDFSPFQFLLVTLAFSAIYLCAGYVLFPKVLEE